MIIVWVNKIPKFLICFFVVFICGFIYCGETFDRSAVIFEDSAKEITFVLQDSPDIFLENPENSKSSDFELMRTIENVISEDDPETPEDIIIFKKKHAREIVISAVGDLTLGSEHRKSYGGSFYEYYDLYGPDYFCENVASVFKDSDCTIANLECALTDNQDPAILKPKEYNYKGYKEYTSVLKSADIDVVTLANNHTYDYSQEGYDDTRDALDNAGVDYFGNGIVLIKEINGIKVGFAGSVGTYWPPELKKALDYLDENGAEIKIVVFHWGTMYEKTASAAQVAVAHAAIDNGADLVIGHHPHVLQGIEIYKGKYIAYSIGNFIFDGNIITDIESRTSIIFQQKFSLYGTEIVDSSINIIPIIITSSMARNNFQPVFANEQQQEDILHKIEERSIY